MQVLVLNQNYEALTVTDPYKAFVMLYLGKAELIEAYENRFLSSINSNHPYPSIVRLRSYIMIPYKRIMLSRKNILRRDNNRCQYCNRHQNDLTIDHVIPKSLGGQDTWENLVAACHKCNNKKGSRTPDQANMPLLSKPFKPSHVLFLRQYVNFIDEKWKPYLFMN